MRIYARLRSFQVRRSETLEVEAHFTIYIGNCSSFCFVSIPLLTKFLEVDVVFCLLDFSVSCETLSWMDSTQLLKEGRRINELKVQVTKTFIASKKGKLKKKLQIHFFLLFGKNESWLPESKIPSELKASQHLSLSRTIVQSKRDQKSILRSHK